MNVLLINPIARARAVPNCFPTGLGYIAAVLKGNGHDVMVLDWNAYRWEEDVFKIKLRFQTIPDLIGLTGIITQYGEVKRISRWCRELWSNVPIACGGVLATSVPGLLLGSTDVNTVILGEGEEVIFDLMDDVLEGRPRSISRTYDSKTVLIRDLSKIPWPEYDLFPMDIYLGNPIGPYNPNKWKDGRADAPLTMNVVGSRGCPAACHYCYHNYMGQGYRVRGAKDLVDEISMLKDKYGAEYVQLVDDAFACSKRKVMAFCDEVIRLEVRWSCAGRANIVDEEMVSAMAEAGCVGIWYGLESGSQRMLDAMNKGLTVRQYRKAIALNRKHFEYEDYTFIVGTPGETDETVGDSIRFCKDLGIRPSAVFYMTPYPGTPLFNQLLREDSEFHDLVNTDDLFEQWVLSLSEQGERIAWNCSGSSDEKLHGWHQKFVEETDALNRRD